MKMPVRSKEWDQKMFKELDKIIETVKESQGWNYYLFAKAFPTIYEFFTLLGKLTSEKED